MWRDLQYQTDVQVAFQSSEEVKDSSLIAVVCVFHLQKREGKGLDGGGSNVPWQLRQLSTHAVRFFVQSQKDLQNHARYVIVCECK